MAWPCVVYVLSTPLAPGIPIETPTKMKGGGVTPEVIIMIMTVSARQSGTVIERQAKARCTYMIPTRPLFRGTWASNHSMVSKVSLLSSTSAGPRLFGM